MSDDNENFANYPQSLNAARDPHADAWTPREALIDMLKRIDSGQTDPKHLVVVAYEEIENGGTNVVYSVSAPNLQMALGIIESAKLQIRLDG